MVNLVAGDTLITVDLGDGMEATITATSVGGVRIFPSVSARIGGNAHPIGLLLDLRAWHAFLADVGFYLPLRFASRTAAYVAARRFHQDVTTQELGPITPGAVAEWARWWTTAHPDATLLTGGDHE
ncbi:hypothetical protein BS329_38740 [Amycolatopsis coloradensis]|uniref:Uncharacterized protein n=1 Tax=Amycolatopsis coloradensis TaxID=76021 RepID=A0A1R0KEN9_9PSEU|nr:hypothetical protein [Amycolatopsis coloradensis]OLZ43597.1 hypothetical protein BS329_38740 [Amycolatopsis coloradensis]